MLEPIVQIWEDFYNLIVGGLSTGTELKLNNCNIFWTILVTTYVYGVSIVEYDQCNVDTYGDI